MTLASFGIETVLEQQIIKILEYTLQLDHRGNKLNISTALFGSLPEFDSMAVVSILTAIEDEFGITVDDEEIEAATFETVGSLVSFVESKLI